MQRLLGLTTSDPSFVAQFVGSFPGICDVTRDMPTGGWGLGLYGNGEMLVRKAPISPRLGALGVLSGTRARQLVLVADDDPVGLVSADMIQPHRYRDWIFAVTGLVPSAADFVAESRGELQGFAGAPRSLSEAAMMLLVAALSRGHLLDGRALSTGHIHEALAEGAARITAIARGLGGPPQLAVLVHVAGYLFGLALGRPLRLVRQSFPTVPRQPRRDVRMSALTDQAVDSPHEAVVSRGIEVAADGATKAFALEVSTP